MLNYREEDGYIAVKKPGRHHLKWSKLTSSQMKKKKRKKEIICLLLWFTKMAYPFCGISIKN